MSAKWKIPQGHQLKIKRFALSSRESTRNQRQKKYFPCNTTCYKTSFSSSLDDVIIHANSFDDISKILLRENCGLILGLIRQHKCTQSLEL